MDRDLLRPFLGTALAETDFAFLGEKYKGKVRDVYRTPHGERVLVATDRQSAFDRLWCTIPLKGQVLTQLSGWWFKAIEDVMPTHLLAMPDPNVQIARNLSMIKVEIVVRAYLTGSTETSAWVNYRNGVRNYCGNILPEGMRKNQKFPAPILSPTTKGERDELIDPDGIVTRGLLTREQWEEVADRAFAVFRRGQEVAAQQGLILVDTKYEMGYDEHGRLTIGDEVHTPDSSRYWIAESYEERFARGEEPESLDKEFFRLWLKSQGFNPEKPGTEPAITDEVRLSLSAKYVELYERMTGEQFQLPTEADVLRRIERNVRAYVG